MPDPQLKERVKDVPARGLRAIFAGIGSLLGVTDKIRNNPAATAPASEPTGNVTVVPPATPEDSAITEDSATPEEAPEGALPLANYGELSIASLRARLRNLSPEQLTQLIEYEKRHAGRADVITMFERRIAKLAAEA